MITSLRPNILRIREKIYKYNSHSIFFSKSMYFLPHPLKKLRSGDNQVTTNTPTAQVTVFKYHSPLKGIQALWRNGWFQVWDRNCTGWTWDILSHFNKRDHIKRMQGPTWRGSHYPKVESKYENDHDGLKYITYINIHELIMVIFGPKLIN